MKYKQPLLALFMLVIISGSFLLLRPRHSQLPSTIGKKIDFQVIYPIQSKDEVYKLDASSVKLAPIDKNSNVLSFRMFSNANSIVVTEQAYPEVLNYDQLVNSIEPYAEVGTSAGKVSLGRPKSSGGHQVAVLKYNETTLIFAKPDHDMTELEWRNFLNQLKPNQ
jgi:hypothetical protein